MPPKAQGKKSGGGGGAAKSKQQEEEDLLRAFEQQGKQKAAAAESEGEQHQSKALTAAERKRQREEAKKQADAEAGRRAAAELERQRRLAEMQSSMQQLRFRQMMMNQMHSPFLNKPKTDVATHGFPASTAAGIIGPSVVGEAQGWRRSMEDAHFVLPDWHEEIALIGVFDGHAGDKCAKMCAKLLPLQLLQQLSEHEKKEGSGKLTAETLPAFLEAAFPVAFQELDKKLKAHSIPDESGSTGCVVAVTKKHVICASVGDSRAVVGAAGNKAVALAEDHKPENPEERKRIEAAGGHVEANRVNGELAMSRALGDFRYKNVKGKTPQEQLVTAVPDVKKWERTHTGEEFLCVACDGIFDVLSNDQLVQFANSAMKASGNLDETVKQVVGVCIAPPDEHGRPSRMGTDNCSLVIAKL